MKPGWQTTEFWTTVGTVVGTIILVLLNPEQAAVVGGKAEVVGGWATTAAIVASGLATAAYAISRGMAKKN